MYVGGGRTTTSVTAPRSLPGSVLVYYLPFDGAPYTLPARTLPKLSYQFCDWTEAAAGLGRGGEPTISTYCDWCDWFRSMTRET